MKPVIKKSKHYSLVFMRDDCDAHTIRLNSKILRTFFIVLLLLTLCGIAGTYGGVHYWRKYRLLSEKCDVQDRDISDMRLQLERLTGLEALLTASGGTLPYAKNEEVGAAAAVAPRSVQTGTNSPLPSSGRKGALVSRPDSGAAGSPANAASSGKATASDSATAGTAKNTTKNEPERAESTAPSGAAPGAASGAAPSADAGKAAAAASQSGTALAAAPATDASTNTPTTTAATTSPASPLAMGPMLPGATPAGSAAQSGDIASDESPVKVNSFSVRIAGRQRFRLKYELSVANPESLSRNVSGSAVYYALLEDGSRHKMTPQDGGTTRFSISRMKLMQGALGLPQGVTTDGVKEIEVEVTLSDESKYSGRYEVR